MSLVDPTKPVTGTPTTQSVRDNFGIIKTELEVFEAKEQKNFPKSPELTYSGGLLSRIDYENGSYKVFTYNTGVLSRVDYVIDSKTFRKDLVYYQGVLISIQDSEI